MFLTHTVLEECYNGTMENLLMHRPQLEKLKNKLIEEEIV